MGQRWFTFGEWLMSDTQTAPVQMEVRIRRGWVILRLAPFWKLANRISHERTLDACEWVANHIMRFDYRIEGGTWRRI